MMLIVAGVGSLIVAYSIGYMDGDDEERRYFAYMSLFVFSMLMLVQGGNLLLLLVGWGLVGLSSYLLIGFHHDRPSAVAAAKKAFIMNAFGDATMALAFFVLIQKTGTLDYGLAFTKAHGLSSTVLNLVALGLLGGAVAKSAQLPLQTWLPDAMEGPTPVSALIHAATMVTAGVYLIVRTHPLFELAPKVQDLAAGLGAATLLMAGLIALVQTDIKRVIAYSTMSQIGYMFLGAGLGAYARAMFHLMTHAFFKALLFLGAGIVIHLLSGEQDIRKMGGLRRMMPRTWWAMLVGGLALSGIPPLSGFFSKDSILASALDRGWYGDILFGVGLVGTFLTGLYTFRMLFIVFGGEPSAHVQEHPPHEHGDRVAQWSMYLVVTVLSLLAAVGGWIQFADRWTPSRTSSSRSRGRSSRRAGRRRRSRASRQSSSASLGIASPGGSTPRTGRRLRSRRARSSRSSTSTSCTTGSSTGRRSGSRAPSTSSSRARSSAARSPPSPASPAGAARAPASSRPASSACTRSRSPPASPSSSSSSWWSSDRRARLDHDDADPAAARRGAARSGSCRCRASGSRRRRCCLRCSRSASGSRRLARFDFDRGGLQESSRLTWFKDLGVSYHVGMFEGFSVWLVGLTVIVMAASIAYGMWAGRDKPRAYYGLMLFLTGAIVGVFTAQDLLLFYVFWEAMLIPLYVLIGVWGGPGRMQATIKFVVYTMVGSLLMLAAVIVYGLQAGTFSMIDGGTNASDWIFLGFAAAFAVKAPLFPFHGWLPDAYRESPAEVSAVLSGVVSKAAAFGFLRICFSLFPVGRARLPDADPRARRDRARLRLAARVPRAGHPRGDRLLLDGAARPRHARPVRDQRPRDRRRRAADGQPRADLGDAVPARGRDRAARGDRAASTRSAASPAAGPRSRPC